jgi:diguanylate cyclase (GGDEF)-like protein
VLLSYSRISKVSRQASTDTLTGLYNRSLLEKTLGRLLALSKRDNKPLSILMLDLNKFKDVNDRFGHGFGDEVLRQSARAIAESIRKSDFIFRYGGDEFLLILPETGSTGAVKTAHKIRENMGRISLKAPRGGNYDGVDSSIGVASFPEVAKDEKDLLTSSDKALYLAKKKKDHVEVAK